MKIQWTCLGVCIGSTSVTWYWYLARDGTLSYCVFDTGLTLLVATLTAIVWWRRKHGLR
jgi:hypothetical protein